MGDVNECRICLLKQNNNANLIQPCKCSTSYVHTTCLQKWRQHNRNNYKYSACEICRSKYNITRICKSKQFKSRALQTSPSARARKRWANRRFKPSSPTPAAAAAPPASPVGTLAPAAAAAPARPLVWHEMRDAHGNIYYWSWETGSVWRTPTWVDRSDEHDNVYYENTRTGRSVWERPAAFVTIER